jgi:glycosyltransferase involved in cell wall biosynthesis
MSKSLDISVVVPLYNEAESLPELVAWIDRVTTANGLTYEIIMVDDGSTDDSWSVVERLKQEYSAIRGISFARNYGKSAALYCGFEMAEGEVVFTMDADLQDSPDEIPEMRRMILEEGYDLVSGWKKKRYDPIGKRWPSKFFNFTARVMSGIKLHDFNCGLKAYRRKVVKSIEVYGEMHRYIPILAKHAGFKRIGEKVVAHQERKYGVSKFGIERMVKGYLDLISVTFMSYFGRSPMYLFGSLGTLMFLFGGVTAVWIIIDKIYSQFNGLMWRGVTEQPMFYLALLAIVLGVQLFLAGFLGEMINRRAGERNHYLIDKKIEK